MLGAIIAGLFLALVYCYILKKFAIISSKGSVYKGIALNIVGFILRFLTLGFVFLLFSKIDRENIVYVFIGFLVGYSFYSFIVLRHILRQS